MPTTTRTRTNRGRAASTTTQPSARPAPDQLAAPAARTDAEDKLWAALHADPNTTTADLATTAGIGRSTAAKILTRWAGDGSVTRLSGNTEGRGRPADLWAITHPDTTPAEPDTEAAAATPEGDPGEVGPVADDPGGPGDTARDDPADAADPAPATPAPADATVGDTTGAARAGSDDAEGSGSRLAPGALRAQVEDYLRDHPDEHVGPTAIAQALGGKSSGAVSNALDKLVVEGTAVRTQDKPRRYALAPAERTTTPPTVG